MYNALRNSCISPVCGCTAVAAQRAVGRLRPVFTTRTRLCMYFRGHGIPTQTRRSTHEKNSSTQGIIRRSKALLITTIHRSCARHPFPTSCPSEKIKKKQGPSTPPTKEPLHLRPVSVKLGEPGFGTRVLLEDSSPGVERGCYDAFSEMKRAGETVIWGRNTGRWFSSSIKKWECLHAHAALADKLQPIAS